MANLSGNAAVVNQPSIYPIIENPIASRNVDENGETVIFEGICDTNSLEITIANQFGCGGLSATNLGAITILGWCAIGYPLGCYCGKLTANSWRAYLTNNRVHYTRINPCCLCGNGIDIHLDLSDISTVSVEMDIVEKGYCALACCHKTIPTTVLMVLKPGQRKDLVHWSDRPLIQWCTEVETVAVRIKNCSNAKEFVQAVQSQMATCNI